jgi:hypothetical protein
MLGYGGELLWNCCRRIAEELEKHLLRNQTKPAAELDKNWWRIIRRIIWSEESFENH